MRLSDPRWFLDPEEPALERGIRKLNEWREARRRGWVENGDCPECGHSIPPRLEQNVIPGCRECGWMPEIFASNIIVPNPRTGFRLYGDF